MTPLLHDLNVASRALLHVQVALEAHRPEQAKRAAAAGEKVLVRIIHRALAESKRRAELTQIAFSNN